ncbi:hypothetical protein OSB04_030508 [Centaurea solstitialis]|uniref:Uncharacterized protein n=1 Tax=Centaurea solstitialis TaxID=347529 RepID=A0AA38SKD9_9ASTR|nr:hypothetical protein OSB04_030508 [Centaurea solstitialis]
MAWLGAMSFYVVGLMMMQTQGEQASYRQFQPTSYTCKLVKPGIFGAGASFALTSIVLQILYLVATHHDDDTTSIPPATQSSEASSFIHSCYKHLRMVSHGDQSSTRTTTAITPIVGATMALLSAVLGFVAEATTAQLLGGDDEMERGCTYSTDSKSPAQMLGILAVLSLLFFQPLSRLLWLDSPLFLPGALTFYIVGLVMIANQGEEIRYGERLQDGTFQSYYVCKVVKPGIFGAGASFALTTIVLQIIYLVATSHHDGTATVAPSTQRSEVTMA